MTRFIDSFPRISIPIMIVVDQEDKSWTGETTKILRLNTG